jgi:hypothetical protein
MSDFLGGWEGNWDKGGGFDGPRIPYLKWDKKIDGQANIFILSDFTDKTIDLEIDGEKKTITLPRAAIFASYSVNTENGFRSFAYDQGDTLHPAWVEEQMQKEAKAKADGKKWRFNADEPFRHMSTYCYAYIFNVTAYRAVVLGEVYNDLTRYYKATYGDTEGFNGLMVAELKKDPTVHLKQFYKERQERNLEPTVLNDVFALSKKLGDNGFPQYSLVQRMSRGLFLSDEGREEGGGPEIAEAVSRALFDAGELDAPKDKVERKRYKPTNASSSGNGNGSTPRPSAAQRISGSPSGPGAAAAIAAAETSDEYTPIDEDDVLTDVDL